MQWKNSKTYLENKSNSLQEGLIKQKIGLEEKIEGLDEISKE